MVGRLGHKTPADIVTTVKRYRESGSPSLTKMEVPPYIKTIYEIYGTKYSAKDYISWKPILGTKNVLLITYRIGPDKRTFNNIYSVVRLLDDPNLKYYVVSTTYNRMFTDSDIFGTGKSVGIYLSGNIAMSMIGPASSITVDSAIDFFGLVQSHLFVTISGPYVGL
jgi:hypothetical protein